MADAAVPWPRVFVRSMADAAVPPAAPCSGCARQLIELRKEMLAENQRIWSMYEGMLEVNDLMLKKLCDIESEAAKRQVQVVQTMVSTSYRILSSGSLFMGGLFLGMSPFLKAVWQEDTIDAMEQRLEKEGYAMKGKEESPSDEVGEVEGTD